MTFKQLAKGQGKRLYITQEERDLIKKLEVAPDQTYTVVTSTAPTFYPLPCDLHCHCQSVTVGDKPHMVCCMCGHRQLRISSPGMIPTMGGKTFD
mgnify:CR=1 FL=1